MVLYAALRGSTLYVATWSPGASGSNDHFLFVTDQLLPSATANAPWAKSGKVAVASTKPYLASESLNSYITWNNAPASAQAVKAATSSGAMEGTIDLVAAFGYMPTNIYLCAAAYQTADGGALAAQCPAGSGPDIDPGEFFVIPTAALPDSNADGNSTALIRRSDSGCRVSRLGAAVMRSTGPPCRGIATSWFGRIPWVRAGVMWTGSADDRRPAPTLALLHGRPASLRHPALLSR